jgi:Cof subfamily protein (haloacid dehalogenase superfamily)
MQEVKRTVPDGKSAAQDRKSTAPDGKSAALDEKPAIKAAFFDIDGTLFSHRTQCVPESTLHALKCLREKGILCIIATGRHISEMREMNFLNYGFDAYLTLNGQVCLDSYLETVFGTPMEGDNLRAMVDIFESHEIPAVLISKDRMYINFVNDAVQSAHREIHTIIPEVGLYAGEPIYMGVIYCTRDLERPFVEKLRGCNITRWSRHGLDIIPGNGDKVEGIRKYIELNSITADEIIAFGDGENDIGMLKYAGLGVALGNAGEEVKTAADYVTADIDEDGVWKALEHFQIITTHSN